MVEHVKLEPRTETTRHSRKAYPMLESPAPYVDNPAILPIIKKASKKMSDFEANIKARKRPYRCRRNADWFPTIQSRDSPRNLQFIIRSGQIPNAFRGCCGYMERTLRDWARPSSLRMVKTSILSFMVTRRPRGQIKDAIVTFMKQTKSRDVRMIDVVAAVESELGGEVAPSSVRSYIQELERTLKVERVSRGRYKWTGK
jgi:hypothetical protein